MAWISPLVSAITSRLPDCECITSCFGGRTEDNRVIVEEGAFTVDTSRHHVQVSNCCNGKEYKEQNVEAWNALSGKFEQKFGDEVAKMLVEKYFPLDRQGSLLQPKMVKELAQEAREVKQVLEELHKARLYHEHLLIEAKKVNHAMQQMVVEMHEVTIALAETKAATQHATHLYQEAAKTTEQKSTNSVLEQLRKAKENEAQHVETRARWRSYFCCDKQVVPLSQKQEPLIWMGFSGSEEPYANVATRNYMKTRNGTVEEYNRNTIRKIISDVPVSQTIEKAQVDRIVDAVMHVAVLKETLDEAELEHLIIEKLLEEGIMLQMPQQYRILEPVLSESGVQKEDVLIEKYRELRKQAVGAGVLASSQVVEEDPDFAVYVKEN